MNHPIHSICAPRNKILSLWHQDSNKLLTLEQCLGERRRRAPCRATQIRRCSASTCALVHNLADLPHACLSGA